MLQTFFVFFLKNIVITCLLLAYYCAALRNNRLHYYNRFYLLATVALSLLLPFVNMPLFTFNSNNDKAIDLLNVIYAAGEPDAGVTGTAFVWNWEFIAAMVCIVITAFLLLFQFYRIVQLYRIKKNYPVQAMHDFDFVITDLQQAPFSFLRNIFWRNDISLEETSGRLILQHEITHVREKHTWDKLFMQTTRALLW